jgi:hypothetical protein
LHEISNDNGVKTANFAISKNIIKSAVFPHRNINKYTQKSTNGQTYNQIDHILSDRLRYWDLLMFDHSAALEDLDTEMETNSAWEITFQSKRVYEECRLLGCNAVWLL